MGLIQGINEYLTLLVETIRQAGRVRIWLLLLGYFLLNWLVLYAHYSFHSPLFYGLVSPWLHFQNERLASAFTHYPGHLQLLPYFAGWAKFYMGIIFEGGILGIVSVWFFHSFVKVEKEDPLTFSNGVVLWIQLVIAWLIINLFVMLVNTELPRLLDPVLSGSPRRILLFRFAVQPGLYMLILAAFYLVIPYVAVYRYNVASSFKRSVLMFFRHPFMLFFLAVIVLIVPVALTILLSYQGVIVRKFDPELVYWLLLVGLAVDMGVNFLWMGTSVRFLVDRE